MECCCYVTALSQNATVSPDGYYRREQIIRCGTDGHHNFVRAIVGALNV